MSETPIADAVESALAGALSEAGSMLSGFFCIAATIYPDGSTGMAVPRPEGQPIYAGLGMVAYAREWLEDDVRCSINADDE